MLQTMYPKYPVLGKIQWIHRLDQQSLFLDYSKEMKYLFSDKKNPDLDGSNFEGYSWKFFSFTVDFQLSSSGKS